jgi:hypothetical protein
MILRESVGRSVIFLVGPFVALANCLPLSPGGIGVAEATSDTLFGSFSVSAGAEMMLLVRTACLIFALPGILGVFQPTLNDVRAPTESSSSNRSLL